MEEEKNRFNRQYVKRLLLYLKPYLPQLILALFIILCLIGTSLSAPLVIKITIDNYIMKGKTYYIEFLIERYRGEELP